jgi:hypothetical protein
MQDSAEKKSSVKKRGNVGYDLLLKPKNFLLFFSISIQVRNLPSKEMTKMNRELGKNSREKHFTRTFIKLRNIIKYDGN